MNGLRIIGAPGEIRTPDHLVRSQVLYPTELRALRRGGIIWRRRRGVKARANDGRAAKFKSGGERGIRTLDGLLTHTPLAGERLQPLGHLSAESGKHTEAGTVRQRRGA